MSCGCGGLSPPAQMGGAPAMKKSKVSSKAKTASGGKAVASKAKAKSKAVKKV